MTFHLFGNILTGYGTAANNRGENEGNTTTLQKIYWKGNIHTTVSAEAIRWALRYYWQTTEGCEVNRQWVETDSGYDYDWRNSAGDKSSYIDDDVLGYMTTEAAKIDNSDVEEESASATQTKTKAKKKKGTANVRRGCLEITRAVSLHPYLGDTTFNAKGGEKTSTSLYGTEVHATCYQYGFALTPNQLEKKSRTLSILSGLSQLTGVAGNQSRFLYDFSPESMVLRWTHDFAPRLLYCFDEVKGVITVPDLIRRVDSGDIPAQELWIAGSITDTPDGEQLEDLGVNLHQGIKSAIDDLIQVIRNDLELEE
jgi:CRISPR-associated protein Cst2